MPPIDPATSRLRVLGMVEEPFELSYAELRTWLTEMLGYDVQVAYEFDDQPIEPIHGGPVRLVVPKKYFWKSAKWVNGIELLNADRKSFSEMRSY